MNLSRSRLMAVAARRQRGFTLLEVLITVTIMGAMAVVIIPRFQDDSELRVVAAATLVASDLEYAQVLSISHPAQPAAVQFDPGNAGYWVAYAADPSQPLVREDTGDPYAITFGAGRARTVAGVSLWVLDASSNRVVFDANGALVDFTDSPKVILGCNGFYRTISIAPSTGTLTITEGAQQGWTP